MTRLCLTFQRSSLVGFLGDMGDSRLIVISGFMWLKVAKRVKVAKSGQWWLYVVTSGSMRAKSSFMC